MRWSLKLKVNTPHSTDFLHSVKLGNFIVYFYALITFHHPTFSLENYVYDSGCGLLDENV
jgi:hypothetical protein